MAQKQEFWVRFWGVRGTVACATEATARYGGNTSALEVRCGPHVLYFDSGTGAYPLGQQARAEGTVKADVFFTHTHYDHIAGLPFFQPVFDEKNHFDLWAGHLLPDRELRDVLSEYMSAPFHPVPLEIMKANVSFNDFTAGDTLTHLDGVTVRTAPLNHPNRATGYRVEYGGKAICYVTDTEHVPGKPDKNVLGLIEGADIVIYDCTYTDQEFPKYVGWGHSTWQEGVRLCEEAGAKTLVIFHHAPEHDDAFMDLIAAEAERLRPGTVVAREGMVLKP